MSGTGEPVPSGRTRRRARLAHGLRSEWVALGWLMLRGWRPLARRWSAPGGEIDLVVVRGRVVAFVEVKARIALGDAVAALGPVKRRRILRAVRAWRARNRWADTGYSFRVDAVYLARRCLPLHVADVVEIV